ncbi:MAG: hypothetical protein ABSC47_02075 [Terracidiphilus sp.]|jgi:uncharacterized protein involved in exopolysaccharide biosynthesis
MTPMHLQPEPMDRLLPGDGAVASSSAAARPAAARHGAQALFRLDLLRSLQMHRRLALGIALAGVALAVAYWFLTGPVYVAQSVVYVQPAPPRVMTQGPSWPYTQRWPYDSNTYESYITQQMQNVTRADVLTGALHKLEAGVWQQGGESEQAAAERLRHSIEVTRQGTGYQFSISARASDPAVAAQVANAVAASFIDSASHEQKAGDTQRLAVLGEERERVQKALAADRAEQEALNRQLGVAAIGTSAPDVYDEDIGRIRGELVTARTAHDEAAAKLTTLVSGNASSSAALDAEADEIAATDAGLVSMKTSLNQRRAVLISQMANLTPNHPQYKQDAEELSKINGTLDSMMKDLRAKAATRIQQKLRTDLERTAQVESRLNAQLGQLTGAAGSATSKLQRSNDLAVDINRLQNRFTTVDEEWRNLMLEEGAPGSAFLSAAAVPPLRPVTSGVLRNTALLVFAGLLFGMLAAVIAHKMDPRVYIAADVEQVLGFAPMAQLPDFVEVSDGVAEEHLLRLAAAIEYARKQGNLKNCIFTGAAPGTGVTTLVTRVRDMLQAMGRKTLLVDAAGSPSHAPRPSLAGSGQPDTQALVATQRGSRPTALLQQMAEETQTQEESLVLADTAPLAVSAETEYLARFVDCAIVVVESGVTTRAQLREAASILQRLDVAAVGFVLNRVGMEKADPAFRLSVRAIETHLLSQGGSNARRAVRSRPLVADAAPADATSFKETPVLRQFEPIVPEPVAVAAVRQSPPAVQEAAAPRSSPAVAEVAAVAAVRLSPPAVQEAAAPRSSPAVPDRSTKPGEPARVPPRMPRMPQALEAIQPMTNQNSDLPWWLADLYPQPDQPRTVAQPDAASVGGPKSAVAAFPPAAAAPKPHPQLVQSWERLPSEYDRTKPAAANPSLGWKRAAGPAEVLESEPEETAPNLSTRLSGLRNLLSVLGKKEQPLLEDPAKKDAEAVRQFDTAADRPAFSRTIAPAPAAATPAAGSAAGASPAQVTAVPEFLPPRLAVEVAEKKKARVHSSRNQRDRLDTNDDVQILPSWRGQYKNR